MNNVGKIEIALPPRKLYPVPDDVRRLLGMIG